MKLLKVEFVGNDGKLELVDIEKDWLLSFSWEEFFAKDSAYLITNGVGCKDRINHVVMTVNSDKDSLFFIENFKRLGVFNAVISWKAPQQEGYKITKTFTSCEVLSALSGFGNGDITMTETFLFRFSDSKMCWDVLEG